MPNAPNALPTVEGSTKMPAPITPLMMVSVSPGTPITRFKPSSEFVFVIIKFW